MICKTDKSLLPSWDPSDNSACVVDYCKQLMDISRKGTCGQCVFCREGTWQVHEIIRDITEGNSESRDFELLLDVLGQIVEGASCEMARESAERCIRLMKEYEEEWDKHIRRKRCANLVCKCSYTLYIDPQICDGCGECLKSCPSGVIAGEPDMIHVINTDMSGSVLLSVLTCPKAAIKKAGSVKPKLPLEPVPVGSFGNAKAGNGDGVTRRRRRRG